MSKIKNKSIDQFIKKKRLKLRIIISIMASFWLIAAVVLFCYDASQKSGCTVKTEAVVTEMKSKLMDYKGTHNRGAHKQATVYTPVFEYEYNGHTYRSSTDNYTNPPSCEVGDVTEIYINPDYPDKIYNPGDGSVRKWVYILLGAWVVNMILFVGILPIVLWN